MTCNRPVPAMLFSWPSIVPCSLINFFLFAASVSAILQRGRTRRLSERSSLSCLAGSPCIFHSFQTSALWNLLAGYPARLITEHLLFFFMWMVLGLFVLVCMKLTEVSRIRRNLIQDLALLELETSAQEDGSKSPVGTVQANA